MIGNALVWRKWWPKWREGELWLLEKDQHRESWWQCPKQDQWFILCHSLWTRHGSIHMRCAFMSAMYPHSPTTRYSIRRHFVNNRFVSSCADIAIVVQCLPGFVTPLLKALRQMPSVIANSLQTLFWVTFSSYCGRALAASNLQAWVMKNRNSCYKTELNNHTVDTQRPFPSCGSTAVRCHLIVSRYTHLCP